MPYVKVSPTVTAGAYTRHDCLGGKLTLEGVSRVIGNDSILESFTVIDMARQESPLAVFLFDENPSNGNYANDDALDIHDTDADMCVGAFVVDAEDYVTVSDKSVATVGKEHLGILLHPKNGTTMYALVKVLGAPTYAAATDVQFIFGIRRF